jgi:hypothetical protein
MPCFTGESPIAISDTLARTAPLQTNSVLMIDIFKPGSENRGLKKAGSSVSFDHAEG